MRLGSLAAAAAVLAVGPAAPAQVIMTFNINATGAKEVTATGTPNQGQPNASAVGTLTLTANGSSGTTGTAAFNLVLTNLTTPLTGMHIHQAPATTTGSIVLPFNNPNAALTGNTLVGTFMGLDNTVINNIFANPSGFYFNMHNTPFPGGAVRDQLSPVPEPSSLALVGTAGLGFLAWRRRRATAAPAV
jgi:hypothetical protein